MRWLLAALGLAGAAAVAIGVYLFYSAPQRALRAAIAYERHAAGLERRELVLPDGLRYVYLEGGRGAPLLLLHGFGANKDNFVRVAKYLTPHYRVIAPDHIGFGESSHPAKADYAPRAQAERLHVFARQLGLSRLHLGGNSMGGHIALTYAARYPKEVESLWLLNAAGVWSAPPSELRRRAAQTGDNPLTIENEDEFAALVSMVTARPLMIPRPILDVLAQERIRNFALEERIARQLAADSVEERIRGLAVPSLIVWGAEDRVLHPGSAGILQMLLIRSEVIVMRNVGHLPMIEEPEASALDYLRFRAGLPPSESAR
ncbi:MAG: alpha/beta hydrolase [Betaproteobacteria bacterium]|nr:alpha/beta hydrolase [Betaproteobacteria bacterium]